MTFRGRIGLCPLYIHHLREPLRVIFVTRVMGALRVTVQPDTHMHVRMSREQQVCSRVRRGVGSGQGGLGRRSLSLSLSLSLCRSLCSTSSLSQKDPSPHTPTHPIPHTSPLAGGLNLAQHDLTCYDLSGPAMTPSSHPQSPAPGRGSHGYVSLPKP